MGAPREFQSIYCNGWGVGLFHAGNPRLLILIPILILIPPLRWKDESEIKITIKIRIRMGIRIMPPTDKV